MVTMKTEETDCMISSSRSKDLLLRFSGEFSPDEMPETTNGSDSDEIELGLSLGGCFNSSNCHQNRILRTSSIPSILPTCEISPLFPLLRSCSLPDEDLQSKRRIEAKRKREDSPVLKLRRIEDENSGLVNGDSSPAASRWFAGVGLRSRQRIVPDGSDSSGGLELESKLGQGFEISGFSHASKLMTKLEQNMHKSPPFSPFSTTPISKPINDTAISNVISVTKEMPLVSAKGDGPNGLTIQGFLYKYGKGEEVRIVCVCHGNFLTPAEFVKHAGGGDVLHPLRHIVVSTNHAYFL